MRSADGTCNNIQHPEWGARHTPFTRLMPAAYEDGMYDFFFFDTHIDGRMPGFWNAIGIRHSASSKDKSNFGIYSTYLEIYFGDIKGGKYVIAR